MYVKYIHKLVALHVMCNNYTEAGYTLKLHAALLDVSFSDYYFSAFNVIPSYYIRGLCRLCRLIILIYVRKGKIFGGFIYFVVVRTLFLF